jgi:LuxR family maltose regulon positive regulatory protein
MLSTKFNLPPPGANFVRRERLLRLLDSAARMNPRVILVCGPPGFGKTTLVSDWLRTSQAIRGDSFAWLTLESGDDDLTRFLTYLIGALQRIRPGFGGGLLRLLQTHQPQPPNVLATLLINELNNLQGRIFLVLDDFHLLAAQPIQHFIQFLVEHQPPSLCLVLATRSDPPLPLARLRARGHLVEIRQRELCFRLDEASEFLNNTMGLHLTAEQADCLIKQTEGWISGLQLAAISLREAEDRPAFFRVFSGEHPFIADYLTDEVLASLPEGVRIFLLRTSILERLSAPLCEAVSGLTGAQEVLEKLVAANLFITPFDGQQRWYRYHTLFASLLRKRLHDAEGEGVLELHRRASRWYLDNGLVDPAIDHALKGQDSELAAGLIEQNAESWLARGEISTLLKWLEALPKGTVAAHPFAACLLGFALIQAGRPPQQTAALLQEIEASEGRDEYQGETTTLRALMAVMRGQVKEAVRLSEEAIRQLPAERAFFRSLAADSLGMAYTLVGNIDAAARAFQQVVDISSQSDNLMMTLMALTNLAGLHYVQGRLRLAISASRQVLDLADRRIGGQTPLTGKPLFILGEMLREQGDLDAALRYLQEAARLMEDFSEIGQPLARLSIARIHLYKKEWEAAQACIDQARRQAEATQSTQLDDRVAAMLQARFWLSRGELELAREWARGLGLLEQTPAKLIAAAGQNAAFNEIFLGEYLTLVRLYLALDQPEQVLEMVALLQEKLADYGQSRRNLELLVLKALALHQKGEKEEALESLGQALQLAEPEGYQRTFVDEGEPMARLLYQAVSRGISPAYAGNLLKAITGEIQISAKTNRTPPGDLIEPLSGRELEVLRLIAEGLTNQEIARRLYISLSTVKGHTTNIFAKLGVATRTQAVARARGLGILAG